jgi:hypothetical protein
MRPSPPGALRVPFALALLAVVIWFVADFPILRLPLAAGFGAYALCLWRWPRLWLVAVPALLPVFDLAPWSGRFFFDEFDALVLLTAGVLALRDRGVERVPPISRPVVWVLALLAVSYLVATLIALWPPPPITPDSFANYYSPYNSLRVAKGFVWALLLFWPLRRAVARDADAKFLLCLGLLLGLIAVCVVAVYERWLFPGVFAWNTDYRVTSTFSSMHTGDGPIDVWLGTTIPLLGILIIQRRWLALLPLTIGGGVLSLYTLFAATSRGPIVAVAIAYVAGLLALWATRRGRGRALGAAILGLSAAVLISTLGLPILAQTALGQRFTQTGQDATIRFQHWRAALSLRDDSLAARMLGMGLGSFPLLHQQRSTVEPRAAHYSFMSDGPDGFLRLWSGQNLYMGQAIAIAPHQDYQLSISVRSSEPSAVFAVAWCELWLLYSAHCTQNDFRLEAPPDRWQTLRGTIHAGQTGSARPLAGLSLRPPTRITFSVSNAPLRGVDVGAISLIDEQGRELIQNGAFDRGADHWTWAVDSHLPWHTKNLAVYVLIEQGWFGLLALGALLALTLTALARQIAAGDQLSAVVLAALTGFMVAGVTVSTFDQPRLVLMFYLLCLAILCRPTNPEIAGTTLAAAPQELLRSR